MAYGLPTYGESGQTYTDKLNNSIEYVRSEAEAAQAAADAANQSITATTETANEAKELAAASKSFVQGPTDSQVKQLVNDSTSQTNAALSATFAGQSLVVAGADKVLATGRKWAFGLPSQSGPIDVLTDDGTHFPTDTGVDYLTMFQAGAVLPNPLAEWYAYAASHDDADIWLLTAPDPLGPWTWQQVVMSTTISAQFSTSNHVSSPHVFYKNGKVVLTYHGGYNSTQPTTLATSDDGITFTESATLAFPCSPNTMSFYQDSTSYAKIIDAGFALVAVFQANRTEFNSQVSEKTVAVGWALSEPTGGLNAADWTICRKPLIGNDPLSRGPFSPALIRLHGQWLLLGEVWEQNCIYGWVSDTLEPGSFVSIGPVVNSIPAGMSRVYNPEAVFHNGELLVFYTADNGVSQNGHIYCNKIDWKVGA